MKPLLLLQCLLYLDVQFGGWIGMQGLGRMAQSVLGETGAQRLRRHYQAARILARRRRLITKPTDPRYIDILHDQEFQASVAEIRDLTAFDTARLANLWQLCRMTDENGQIVEVGVYKGGTSRHLSNCRPRSTLFACDTFSGYGALPLDQALDQREAEWRLRNSDNGPFDDASPQAVARLLRQNGRNTIVLPGRFPQSDSEGRIGNVSFAHIDVVLYQSCRDALEYLANRATDAAIFVVNDYRRQTSGVDRAVAEFARTRGNWVIVPAYPGQGMLFSHRRHA